MVDLVGAYWLTITVSTTTLVAVMSDEPERVFSITGAAIKPRRRRLTSDKIAYLMCLKQWLKSGILTLDR